MEKIVEFPGLGLEFSFHNSFQIGPFTIAYYGLLIAVGLLLALFYAFRTFKTVGIDSDKAIDCILGGIIGGIVGARLYFVIFSWDSYGLDFSSLDAFFNSFARIFKTWEGGLAIYGGLIGALLVGLLIAKRKKICIRALLDVVGVGFLLGQGIGRWGNFFNVEAFGSNTTLPWGMTSPDIVQYLTQKQSELASIGVTVDPNMPVHPCFLYESIWCIVGFFLLAWYLKRRKFDGEVFLMYLAFYGAERFVVEGLRTDSLMIGSLRVSQLLAAVLVIASVITILVVRSKIRNSHDENYLKLFVLTPEGQAIAAKESEGFFGWKKKEPKDTETDLQTNESEHAEETNAEVLAEESHTESEEDEKNKSDD